MVEPSPDTRNESTNWTKAMRTSGLPWKKISTCFNSHSPTNWKLNNMKKINHTFLSFLFAKPIKVLLMWMLLKTSLAASAPWETNADRKLRHWRTNLGTKEVRQPTLILTFQNPLRTTYLWFTEFKDPCRVFMCPATVFLTIALPTMLKWERSLAVLRRIISRLSKISIN